jgi:hypothetical protein
MKIEAKDLKASGLPIIEKDSRNHLAPQKIDNLRLEIFSEIQKIAPQ